jgi:hypothetical protein
MTSSAGTACARRRRSGSKRRGYDARRRHTPKLGRRRTSDVRRRDFAAARARIEGRFPTWEAALFFVDMTSPRHHPGEGRGPFGRTKETTRCPPLPRPSQLGPGLRRGGAGDWLRDRHASEARRAKTPPPNLSVRAGRRRGVAASGGGRGEAAVPDRHDRNARRNRGSPGSPCRHKSGNRARRDGRAAICKCGR